MPDDAATVPSPWGVLARATTTLTSGETLVHDWYSADGDTADGEPELMLNATDAAAASALLPRVAAVHADRAGWHRRATDAVVNEFSTEEPTADELAEAARDLVLQTVEVLADGDVVLHLDDSCGQHFLDGYWPTVRFDADDVAVEVTVEA
ncbi:hypothetical protein [Promicromonospora kroppenstedtii]|uniref:hypothetical protein n=1 Tax=Promicromonospora kroppenstedtii TaxID=440482 RepID=UPI0004BA9504|nr:hypothetical protein [Promicromonospora kroppenstedtii]